MAVSRGGSRFQAPNPRGDGGLPKFPNNCMKLRIFWAVGAPPLDDQLGGWKRVLFYLWGEGGERNSVLQKNGIGHCGKNITYSCKDH